MIKIKDTSGKVKFILEDDSTEPKQIESEDTLSKSEFDKLTKEKEDKSNEKPL